MLPETYFVEVIRPEHGEMLQILNMDDEHGYEMFRQFMAMDGTSSGAVAVAEFHKFLGYWPTKFSERVFAILDLDSSGLLDFREFLAGVWNYCTYDSALIAKLCFGIFDVDKRGKLSPPELDALVRMLSGTAMADADALRQLCVHGGCSEDDEGNGHAGTGHSNGGGGTAGAGDGPGTKCGTLPKGGTGGVRSSRKAAAPVSSKGPNTGCGSVAGATAYARCGGGIGCNGDGTCRGDISYAEFAARTAAGAQALRPAFELQRAMRRKFLGVEYWEAQTQVRRETFRDYDAGSLGSWEAVAAILAIKQRERVAELERQKQELERRHVKELQRALDTAGDREKVFEERQRRRLDALENSASPEDKAEAEAWEELRAARQEIAREFTTTEMAEARAARQRLWAAHDAAATTTERAAAARDARAMEVATGDDAHAKADVWIASAAGAPRYEDLCQQIYGRLMHARYSRGGPLRRAVAAAWAITDDSAGSPILNPAPGADGGGFGDGGNNDASGGDAGADAALLGADVAPATVAAKWSYRHAPRKPGTVAARAQERARAAVVAGYARRGGEAARVAAAAARQQRREDLDALRSELVAVYRSANTQWERLMDTAAGLPLFVHSVTGEAHLATPATAGAALLPQANAATGATVSTALTIRGWGSGGSGAGGGGSGAGGGGSGHGATICENCDAFLPPEDGKCFLCGAGRPSRSESCVSADRGAMSNSNSFPRLTWQQWNKSGNQI